MMMRATPLAANAIHHSQSKVINQHNEVHVNGAREPQKVADAVRDHQQRFNSRLTRNLPARLA